MLLFLWCLAYTGHSGVDVGRGRMQSTAPLCVQASTVVTDLTLQCAVITFQLLLEVYWAFADLEL